MFLKLLFLMFFCFATGFSFAHGDREERSYVFANAQVNFSNKGSVEKTKQWLIPGTFMGGEALPMEQGMNIKDVELEAHWYNKKTYGLSAKVASHHDGELEFENFYFKALPNSSSRFSLGKLDAAFSPSVSWHAYRDEFNEAPLFTEVNFGGHFTDTGMQYIQAWKNFELGIEIWNGNNWPANSGEYSGDFFLHHNLNLEQVKIKSGVWAVYAESELRSDQRYNNGHSHSSVIDTSNQNTVYFSGEESLLGAFLDLNYVWNAVYQTGIYLEASTKDIDGEIQDESRIAGFEAEHLAYLGKLYLKHSSITYALRYEVLGFENNFTGPAAGFLPGDAGLVNNDFEPSRAHFSISKEIEAFTLRAEAVSDKSYDEDGLNRYSLSLIWQERLWEQK